MDAAVAAWDDYDANVPRFCDLPGSWVHDANGTHQVPTNKSLPDLSWLAVPTGFCVHFFATVGNARTIRFAPGGELFVASPSRGTIGGGRSGASAILVLSDDDRNGLADPVRAAFVSNIASTQGILFANGSFYWQDDATIFKVRYASGDRAPNQRARSSPTSRHGTDRALTGRRRSTQRTMARSTSRTVATKARRAFRAGLSSAGFSRSTMAIL
jgi:hypothetical protein